MSVFIFYGVVALEVKPNYFRALWVFWLLDLNLVLYEIINSM